MSWSLAQLSWLLIDLVLITLRLAQIFLHLACAQLRIALTAEPPFGSSGYPAVTPRVQAAKQRPRVGPPARREVVCATRALECSFVQVQYETARRSRGISDKCCSSLVRRYSQRSWDLHVGVLPRFGRTCIDNRNRFVRVDGIRLSSAAVIL